MKAPLVSILVNAYNAERYIAEALDSALAQTYSNIEVIVLDDHSTDRTSAIVHEYAAGDGRVHYLKPAKRVGLTQGRNELLRASRGEYLTYLDADDIYMPGKVEEEVDFLATHQEYALVYCNIIFFFDGVPGTTYRHRYTFYSGEDVFPHLLEMMFIANTSTMFRREVYDRLGGYRTDLGLVEDWEYFLRLTYAGYKIAFLDRDLVRYRLRWDSHTNFARQADIKQSAVKIFENLKEQMSEADRARYRIDYWIAMRKETYAIALTAVGQGNEARRIVADIQAYVAPIKRAAIIFLSYFPTRFVAFIMERAWNYRKKNLFVEVA
jgi:glycosyltransferase involved in cell wall biosynthesis